MSLSHAVALHHCVERVHDLHRLRFLWSHRCRIFWIHWSNWCCSIPWFFRCHVCASSKWWSSSIDTFWSVAGQKPFQQEGHASHREIKWLDSFSKLQRRKFKSHSNQNYPAWVGKRFLNPTILRSINMGFMQAVDKLADGTVFPKVGMAFAKDGSTKVIKFTRVCKPQAPPLKMRLVICWLKFMSSELIRSHQRLSCHLAS